MGGGAGEGVLPTEVGPSPVARSSKPLRRLCAAAATAAAATAAAATAAAATAAEPQACTNPLRTHCKRRRRG